MVKFETIFKQMLRQKNRLIYLLFLIQLAASLILTGISLVTNYSETAVIHLDDYGIHSTIKGLGAIISSFASIMLGLSFLAALAYLIWASMQNRKMNRSQSWRLIPVSDRKFLAANIGSSLISYVWLGIMQLVVILLGLLPIFLSSAFHQEIGRLLAHSHASQLQINQMVLGSFQFLLMLVLLGLGWFVTVNLISFAARTITDFLPFKGSKAILIIFRFIILIIVLVLISKLFAILANANFNFPDFNQQLWLLLLEFAIYDLIVFESDNFLFKRFIEAKQNN